jgi:hypothetical protein
MVELVAGGSGGGAVLGARVRGGAGCGIWGDVPPEMYMLVEVSSPSTTGSIGSVESMWAWSARRRAGSSTRRGSGGGAGARCAAGPGVIACSSSRRAASSAWICAAVGGPTPGAVDRGGSWIPVGGAFLARLGGSGGNLRPHA